MRLDLSLPKLSRSWLRSFWPSRRIRRPLDLARLPLVLGLLVGLVLLVIFDADHIRAVADLLPGIRRGFPRTVLSIVNLLASLAVLATQLVIIIDALRFRRFALTSAVLSSVVSVAIGFLVASLSTRDGGHTTLALLVGPTRDSPGLTVTAAVAVIVGADLQRRPSGLTARLAVYTAVACATVLGSITIPGALYAILLGASVGLGVRAAVGVVPARPPGEVVQSVIARAGWSLTALRPVMERAGRSRYEGDRPDGGHLEITVVDRDRRGVSLARRVGRLLVLRSAAVGRPALSLRWQLEREALCAALANSAGVATPRVLALLAAGMALVLVEEPLDGIPLARSADLVAADCTTVAETLRQLHNAGMSLGSLTADNIMLLPDGRAGFLELIAAQPAATELQRELDVVALLVALATKVGAAAAVTAVRTGYGTTPAAETRLSALQQRLALPPAARRAVRGTPLLHDLRVALSSPSSDRTRTAAPRLERLRPRTVISVVGGTVAAYLLATEISKVNLLDALRQSRPEWLAVALAGSALTYLGSALAKRAFAPITLPLARTALVQLASSFLALVTPPSVGHVGVNLRYLQRAGVATAAAAASVAVSEVVTVVVTVLVLLLCVWLSGASASHLALLPSGTVLYVLLLAAVVLALAAAVPATRHLLQRRLEPLVRRTLPQLLATASSPRRLGTALAGIMILNGGYVLALDASLRAFSTSLALPLLVVVYFAASTIASAAPTPGGIGAVEAALVGGLTATGIPVTSALTAVLVFRAATFWLPAPLGWGAFVLLQRRGWI